MKIMVFDVAAGSGGALTILKEYYEKALNDGENEWYFVISTPDLTSAKNVRVLKYKWVKKSWFHRLFFDMLIAHRLVQKFCINEVLSLQNILVFNIKVRQTLYLHQPLPFIEKRYKLTENFRFWTYQNVIGKMIFNSISKADNVIVQTKWMKNACLKKVNTNPEKFIVKQPDIMINIKKLYELEKSGKTLFFYPASGLIYKNHKVVIDAAKLLKKRGILQQYSIIFTLCENENKYIKKLYRDVKEADLPISFIGCISIEEVYDYYSRSILIFPSYIETFGLPLLEAKMHNSPVIASDCAFSHEILDDYDKKFYFKYDEAEDLANIMAKCIFL